MPGTFIAAVVVDRLSTMAFAWGERSSLTHRQSSRRYIVHIHRLAGDELHRILFAERLIDYLHCASSSLCFFHSR